MKKFTNKAKQLGQIKYSDGTVQFLFYGEQIKTTKNVESWSDGVICDEPKKKRAGKSKESSIQENESTGE